jgi:hypothetical protein
MALRKKVGLIDWREILLSVRKTLFCSGIMGLAVFAADMMFIPQGHATFIKLLCGLLGTILVGIGSYAGCAFLAKCPEVYDLTKMMGGRTASQKQGSK